MSEFHDYLNDAPTAWGALFDTPSRSSTGWHFCFPRFNSSPVYSLNVYLLGSANALLTHGATDDRRRPSTEEFSELADPTRFPINDIVDAATTSTRRAGENFDSGQVGVLCTSQGQLFIVGIDSFGRAPQPGLFGIGPEALANRFISVVNLVSRSKTARRRFSRVLGENGDLQDVRFVGVAAHRHCLAALDSNGDVWFSGDPCRANFATTSQFPNDTNGLLHWFRKAEFSSYIDASGTVTPASPLTFRKIRAGWNTFLGISTDGDMYAWGSFTLGKQLTSAVPHKVSDFVDSVSLVSGGSNYTSTPTVTVSDPQHANGTRAVVVVTQITNKVITGIALSNPGWGYTSAPTITFSGGGGTGASATAELFSESWSDCAAGYNEDYPYCCAAITESGKLYVTKDRWLYDGLSWFAPGQPSPGAYSTVSLGGDHGVLKCTDGTYGFWGFIFYVRPEGSSASSIVAKSLPTGSVQAAQAFGTGFAVMDTDGKVFTVGERDFAGRGLEVGPNGLRFVTMNDTSANGVSKARFSGLFGTSLATFLNRIESRDELGNLIDPLPPGLPT